MFVHKLMIMTGMLFMILVGPGLAARTALSEQEIADLTYMREEEKLAHDVYTELYQYYKGDGLELIVFANIAVSEQRHMDAMLRLLDKYKLDDPAEGMGQGEFQNDLLAALYENLVSDEDTNQPILGEPSSGGKVSVEAAYYVGAWIEERDMIDIMHAVANTDRANIAGVYTNLLCGSRSHLRAFVKRLGGDDYQPQLLYSAADVGVDVPATETLEYWLGDESDEICL